MLTDLEVSTLKRLANGELIKQIADSESLSHSAIDKRIKRIKSKLEAKTLCEAVHKACKSGVICLLIVSTTSLELEMAVNPDFTDADIVRRVKTRRKESESDYSL